MNYEFRSYAGCIMDNLSPEGNVVLMLIPMPNNQIIHFKLLPYRVNLTVNRKTFSVLSYIHDGN